MMTAPITIQAEIGEDRQLTITLPDDMLPDMPALSDKELETLSHRLPPGQKSIDEMIDEEHNKV